MEDQGWVKSSFCDNGYTCAEVNMTDPNNVRIRNSKNPSSGTASFTSEEWDAFVSGVKNGEFG